jgi:hypothetical protein
MSTRTLPIPKKLNDSSEEQQSEQTQKPKILTKLLKGRSNDSKLLRRNVKRNKRQP